MSEEKNRKGVKESAQRSGAGESIHKVFSLQNSCYLEWGGGRPVPLPRRGALNAIMKISACPHVVSRMIGDRALILVPEHDQIQQLNEVGSLIWSLLVERESSLDELTERVSDRFEVAPQDAREDITDFVELLRSKGLIEVRSEGIELSAEGEG